MTLSALNVFLSFMVKLPSLITDAAFFSPLVCQILLPSPCSALSSSLFLWFGFFSQYFSTVFQGAFFSLLFCFPDQSVPISALP